MRQILLLPLAALLAMPVFSQTPADTTLTIRNIEIQGTRFAGLSERGGMKILRVDNNLSSVTNTGGCFSPIAFCHYRYGRSRYIQGLR